MYNRLCMRVVSGWLAGGGQSSSRCGRKRRWAIQDVQIGMVVVVVVQNLTYSVQHSLDSLGQRKR